jgi:hypothetical protein
LPLPAAVLKGASTVDVRLQLNGSPSREGDYLLVYQSSERGGFLVSMASAAEASTPDSTTCVAR